MYLLFICLFVLKVLSWLYLCWEYFALLSETNWSERVLVISNFPTIRPNQKKTKINKSYICHAEDLLTSFSPGLRFYKIISGLLNVGLNKEMILPAPGCDCCEKCLIVLPTGRWVVQAGRGLQCLQRTVPGQSCHNTPSETSGLTPMIDTTLHSLEEN